MITLFRSRFSAIALLVLIIGNVLIWLVVLVPTHRGLTVSFLDIGQGDSILIQGPTGIQMLVDGGPDRAVLRELPDVMGPTDRSIDLVVETHPDADHIGGLADVFDRYQVSYFASPGIPDTTLTSKRVAASVVAESGLHSFIARRGQRIHLGGGAYADVLFPDRDESQQKDTNAGSVVLHVVYGATSFMLTGDLPSLGGEDYLASLDAADGNLASTVLKAGHHGSKYSTDDRWLAAVQPSIVVISAGKNNRYGHPTPEALARIRNGGASIVSTIDHGTITFTSDGVSLTENTQK